MTTKVFRFLPDSVAQTTGIFHITTTHYALVVSDCLIDDLIIAGKTVAAKSLPVEVSTSGAFTVDSTYFFRGQVYGASGSLLISSVTMGTFPNTFPLECGPGQTISGHSGLSGHLTRANSDRFIEVWAEPGDTISSTDSVGQKRIHLFII